MILVILTILAIEGGQGPPFGEDEYSFALSQGPSHGPFLFYQPHAVFSLAAPHTVLSRGFKVKDLNWTLQKKMFWKKTEGISLTQPPMDDMA